jgi:hypothetical protein
MVVPWPVLWIRHRLVASLLFMSARGLVGQFKTARLAGEAHQVLAANVEGMGSELTVPS